MPVIVAAVLYFLLAAAVLALVMLPGWRSVMMHAAQRAGRACRSVALQPWWRAGAPAWSQGWRHALPSVRALQWPGLALLAVVVAVPLAVAVLRAQWRVETYDHTRSRAPDAHVASLLQGEQLVPPPPLPPELFNAIEVTRVRPTAVQANRDWALLEPEFRRRLLWVFRLMRERHGYELVLLEGWRSPDRQNQLAAMGAHVTRAVAFESQHQHGRAADVAFLRDGRIVISERDPWALRGYELYGELAASLDLVWGGGWSTLRDFGHVEWRSGGNAPTASSPAS